VPRFMPETVLQPVLKLTSNEGIYKRHCIKIHEEDRNKERCELPYANFNDPTTLRNRRVPR